MTLALLFLLAQDPSDAIYDENQVATFSLAMSAGDWSSIVNDPGGQGRLWHSANMTWQGETLNTIAVRASRSYQPGSKPSLRLKFDEFVANRLWRGVDMVKLDALRYDYSMIRDRLGYWAHRQAGAPAPRSCHARLVVNGEFKGLYEVEEPVRKAFGRVRWNIPNTDGNIYEITPYDLNEQWRPAPYDHYEWRGSNPATYVPAIWQPKTNETGGNYQDVVDFLSVLNTSSDRYDQLGTLINMDGFLSYLAVTTAASNFDSILSWGDGPSVPNNHYWFHRDDTNRMEVVAWDVENLFGNEYYGTGNGVGSGSYRVQQTIGHGFGVTRATSWVTGDATANAVFRSKVRQFMNGPLSQAAARADWIHAQIRDHAYADPYKPYSDGQFDAEVGTVKTWIGRRIAYLRTQYPQQTNGAEFVSQSVPGTMTAGQTYAVSVTMRNSGDTTWTEGGGYRLGSQNPQDNTTWGMNRVALPAGASIAPGQNGTYSWTVTAPSAPGTYDFRWQMRQSGVEWFGPLTPNVAVSVVTTPPPPPPTPTNGAQFVSQSVPTTMTAGWTYTVSVVMKNVGTTTWTEANLYRLGSQNPQDNTTWGLNRVTLPPGASIAPNQNGTYSWTLTAPGAVGTYNFQWQMRQSGVEWFGPLSPSVAIDVVDTPTGPIGGPGGSSSRESSEGFCGLTGLESLLVLALISLFRRRRLQ